MFQRLNPSCSFLLLLFSVCAVASIRAPTNGRLRAVSPRLGDDAGLQGIVNRAEPRPLGDPSSSTVVVAGASGYIGRFVVRELVNQGYRTVALLRDPESVASPGDFENAELLKADVCNENELREIVNSIDGGVQGAISCLASRSGEKKESYAVDYKATLDFIDAVRSAGASHFVLLSAICVRKPLLHFQRAKLQLEGELTSGARADLLHSVVRPTAFFKSLSMQVGKVQRGSPFILFQKNDGTCMRSNPISGVDLATYMVECFNDVTRQNRILDVGGPHGEPISMREQGELIFKATGMKPNFVIFPTRVFDVIIAVLEFLAKFFPSLEDTAEFGRIGRYYAVEDMITGSDGISYGRTTLLDHYNKIVEDGEDYDPYAVFGANKAPSAFLG